MDTSWYGVGINGVQDDHVYHWIPSHRLNIITPAANWGVDDLWNLCRGVLHVEINWARQSIRSNCQGRWVTCMEFHGISEIPVLFVGSTAATASSQILIEGVGNRWADWKPQFPRSRCWRSFGWMRTFWGPSARIKPGQILEEHQAFLKRNRSIVDIWW